MKTLIFIMALLFSSVAFANANVYFINEAGTPRCWQGNCQIVADSGKITQTCDTFCNFYCYKGNYKIVCDKKTCHNEFDYYCHSDKDPHQVPANHVCE